MATLQHRSGSYRLLFQYEGKQQTLTIGPVTLVRTRKGFLGWSCAPSVPNRQLVGDNRKFC